MSTAFLRRALVRAAVPALVLAQLAVADAGVLAGALAAGFLGHGHGHALSVRSDDGHVDVVLHHEEDGARRAGGAPLAIAGRDPHAGDHVVHVASADTPREGARRIGPASWLPSAAPALAVRPAFSRPARFASHAPPGASDLLRTVVLRI